MRATISFAMFVTLAACDQTSAPDSGLSAPGREITAERVEAERACAELTGHSPDRTGDATPETRLLRQKEYNSCVASVLGGDKPALRGRAEDAPL